MNLRHLRAFVAVAEELSFTSAARKLHISQPPLSRQIQQLERKIGVKLFLRSSQGIALTGQGERFLQEARELMSVADEFLETAQQVLREGTGAVRIGIDWALWKAVNRIRTHHARQHPGVDITGEDLLGRGDVQDAAQAFRRHRIDVALTRAAVEAASIASEPLFQERIVVLIRDDHPLARTGSVRLRHLASETLLMPDRKASPVPFEKAMGLYGAAAVTPRLIHTRGGPTTQSGLMLVASGEGVYFSVGSGFTQPQGAEGVAVLTLDEPDATIPVLLAFRRDESSEAVLDFVTSARDVFASQAGRQ